MHVLVPSKPVHSDINPPKWQIISQSEMDQAEASGFDLLFWVSNLANLIKYGFKIIFSGKKLLNVFENLWKALLEETQEVH